MIDQKPSRIFRLSLPVLLWIVEDYLFKFSYLFLPKEVTLSQFYVVRLISTLIVILIFVFSLQKYYQADILKRFPISWINILLFLLLFYLNLKIGNWVAAHFPTPPNQQLTSAYYYTSLNEGGWAWSLFFILALIAPLTEELFFRGVLMEAYFKDSPYYLDILLSTILFAAAHLQVGGTWTDFLGYVLKGWGYALIYRQTKSIYYPILLHIACNFGPAILEQFFHVYIR